MADPIVEEPALAGTLDPSGNDKEDALLADLRRAGARINAVPKTRTDGVRGLFAIRNLDVDDWACWVPNAVVLEEMSCEPALRNIIKAKISAASLTEEEQTVYCRMITLAAGYLLERSRGTSSRFRCYIEALPSHPLTVNSMTLAERAVMKLMTGNDVYGNYQRIVELTTACVERAAGLWGTAPVPTGEEAEAAAFFVLSRMSYLRMIPLCDLANAALPGEENAAISVDGQVVDGREGCAVVIKRPVKAGEEVMIDYNHHDALGMLANYGCTLGLEEVRSVTRIQADLPPHLLDLGARRPGAGIQLKEDAPDVIPDEELLLLRMAALGGVEDLITATKVGYFKEGSADAPTGMTAVPPEKLQEWRQKERGMYTHIADFCNRTCRALEIVVGPRVKNLDQTRWTGRVLMVQYETERRLLTKCAKAMEGRAATLLEGGSRAG